jgi:glycosyltransferase involved in cell wall biosynthesis
MNTNPKVSLIIPCFNSALFIRDSIDSVLGQTYTNLEVIVVDDSSTDQTPEIIKKIAEEDDRIKVFQIPYSGRPSVPRNFGIGKSSGELIAFIDSDDLWTRDKLERQVQLFNKITGLTFVYSMSVTFGNVSIFSENYEVLPLHFRAAHNYQDLLTIGNTIPLSSVLADARKIKAAGGFDEDPELKVEDYDLWLRLSKEGDFLPYT